MSSPGYLYVALYAPSDAHTDWQLMLVNTLKKDLESESAPRILMALGFIIHRPFAGIVPMISAVMITLLGDKRCVDEQIGIAFSQSTQAL